MDIIIVCHTEFGFVDKNEVIYDKNHKEGVTEGVTNLVSLADKYGAKITFAVMPEVADYFPKNNHHEIGLHIHSGWEEYHGKKFSWFVGDAYLRQHCAQSSISTVLRDYPYKEQFEMIKKGKEYIREILHAEPKVFVAGRWSLNNDTVKALINNGLTHDCSAVAYSKRPHYDWSLLERIAMPYNPSEDNYQKRGSLPLLMVPISQVFPRGNATVENIPAYGFDWLKACFMEYYSAGAPLFHMCLHSPAMTNSYFIGAMEKLLAYIAGHQNITFKFASEIEKYPEKDFGGKIMPYIFGINGTLLKTALKKIF